MYRGSNPETPHICPQCQSTEIERVPRDRMLNRMVVAVLGWGVYRCRECGVRFYDRPAHRKAS